MKIWGLIFLGFLFVGCASVQDPSLSSKIDFLIERQNIEDTVNRLFIGTDNKNWPEVRSLFTDQVHFDMSSLTGAAPSTMTPLEITGMWDKGLAPVAQVHHQSGNFLIKINEQTADVFCYGTATHYKNPAFKTKVTSFVGSYNVHLAKSGLGWKIDSLRFNKKYVE
jgi:hypothetical protein